ncbi:helix-turn-helix domain-containing protein [Spirillospora sp. CA-128828]|uniref:helix-turn-helix domain-containing protein n=1 Tax=Spirillospora sp. CA-128828 TaxID=3240033 RepID=UPI003D92716F
MEAAQVAPDSPLVHIDVVAEVLGVSSRTVRRMADAGEIPHYRVRGQAKFDLAEVLAVLRVGAQS